MDAPCWLLRSVVIALHDEHLAEHGGADGVFDEERLDSVLSKPRNLFVERALTLPQIAAAYAFGVANKRPFPDGNERTSLMAAELFLDLNGYEIAASDAECAAMWQALGAGQSDEAALADWLQSRAVAKQGGSRKTR